MARSTASLITRALIFGIGGGFRSLSPFAALALNYSARPRSRGWRSWPMYSSKRERGVMIGFAAGEYVTDKLPWTQSRIALTVQPSTIDLGLAGRVALVTIAGAALGSDYEGGESIVTGAAFAAVGAVIGNYLGYFGRRAGTKATGWPDTVVALLEDAAAIGLLAAAVRTEP